MLYGPDFVVHEVLQESSLSSPYRGIDAAHDLLVPIARLILLHRFLKQYRGLSNYQYHFEVCVRHVILTIAMLGPWDHNDVKYRPYNILPKSYTAEAQPEQMIATHVEPNQK